MCQMRIVLETNGEQQTILENAALLEVTGDQINVSALFEEPRIVEHAHVTKIDFLSGTVTLATTEAS